LARDGDPRWDLAANVRRKPWIEQRNSASQDKQEIGSPTGEHPDAFQICRPAGDIRRPALRHPGRVLSDQGASQAALSRLSVFPTKLRFTASSIGYSLAVPTLLLIKDRTNAPLD
jgi:hypothetical protein